jgi:hypothetical protein
VPSVLFYGEICWTKLNQIVILPNFPYKTLRRGLDFKFCLRNFILVWWVKTEWLKARKVRYILNWLQTDFKLTHEFITISTYCVSYKHNTRINLTSSWPKRLQEPKFHLSRSHGQGRLDSGQSERRIEINGGIFVIRPKSNIGWIAR